MSSPLSLLESLLLLVLSSELLESEPLLELVSELEDDDDELPELVSLSEPPELLSESEDDESESEDEEESESDELELSCLRLLRGAEALSFLGWSSASTSLGSINFGRNLGFRSCCVRVGLALYTASPVHWYVQ